MFSVFTKEKKELQIIGIIIRLFFKIKNLREFFSSMKNLWVMLLE